MSQHSTICRHTAHELVSASVRAPEQAFASRVSTHRTLTTLQYEEYLCAQLIAAVRAVRLQARCCCAAARAGGRADGGLATEGHGDYNAINNAGRDSEICAVVTGGETVESTMAGMPWLATKFAHSLRVRLWSEHLGVAAEKLCDPIAKEFYDSLLHGQAFVNTEIYRDVFQCLPDNTVHSLSDLLEHSFRHAQLSDDKDLATQMRNIQGAIEVMRTSAESSHLALRDEIRAMSEDNRALHRAVAQLQLEFRIRDEIEVLAKMPQDDATAQQKAKLEAQLCDLRRANTCAFPLDLSTFSPIRQRAESMAVEAVNNSTRLHVHSERQKHEALQKVRGHLVLFPDLFLCNYSLAPGVSLDFLVEKAFQ